MTTALGNQIRQARKKKGFTQEQLAELLHVSRQTVSNWENDRFEPDYEMLSRIANLLSMDECLPFGQPDVPMQEETPVAKVAEGTSPPVCPKNRKFFLLLIMAILFLMGLVVWICNQPHPSGYSLAWFQQEQINEAGKAFVRLYHHEPIVKAKRGSLTATPMWHYAIYMKEENGVGFTVERTDYVFFQGSKILMINSETEDCLHEFLIDTPTRIGFDQYRQMHFHEAADAVTTGLGFAMYGTDDNGNELTFHTYLSFENEYQ